MNILRIRPFGFQQGGELTLGADLSPRGQERKLISDEAPEPILAQCADDAVRALLLEPGTTCGPTGEINGSQTRDDERHGGDGFFASEKLWHGPGTELDSSATATGLHEKEILLLSVAGLEALTATA